MSDYLPVDVYGRLALMTRLKGFPQAAAYAFDYEGTVDRERLAAALDHVIRQRHPVAGCRIARYRLLFYRWRKVTFRPEDFLFGPFQRLRDFDAFHEPPLRIHLGDNDLVFEMSHVAFDGIGLLRLVRSILEQYVALPRILPPVLDEDALRRGGAYWGEPPRKHGRNPWRRFVHPETGRVLSNRADKVVQTGDSDDLGTHLKHLTLPLPSVREHARVLGCTVNDLLVGALLTEIIRWNRERGAPARFLSVDVPANLRPPERAMELAANASGHFTINILNLNDGPPALGAIVRCVAKEFRQAKEENRHWSGIGSRSTLLYPTEAAVIVGRWLLGRFSNWLLRFAPTAIVSNLGRLYGIDGDHAGLRLKNMRILGTAFSPLTLNSCSPNEDSFVLSFCVRKSLFGQDTLEQFVSDMARLVMEGI